MTTEESNEYGLHLLSWALFAAPVLLERYVWQVCGETGPRIYTFATSHVRADIDRIVAVPVTSVDVPSPRCELLARNVVIGVPIPSAVAAVVAYVYESNRDLFPRDSDWVLVILRKNISYYLAPCIELFDMTSCVWNLHCTRRERLYHNSSHGRTARRRL